MKQRMGLDTSTNTNGRVVFISAAEASADLHGAKLIRAMKMLAPDTTFVGVAGPRMRDAGCEAVFDMTPHAAMLTGAFRVVPQALAMLRASKRTLNNRSIDLAIVIDSPVLHLPIAKQAKQAKVPVLYYIAPQVWAWGARRVRRVQARVDKLAVILAFEQGYFREHGLDAEYVGHPLFDTLTQRKLDQEKVNAIRAKGEPIIAILPGSRKHVIAEVLPGQLEVAAAIAERHPGAHFCISAADAKARGAIESTLAGSRIPVTIHDGENGEVLSAATLTLVASGTATLEAAYYHAPMIVMYNTARLGYQLLSWMITTKHFSLVNILADRRLVPEFMPYYKSTAPITAQALELLGTPGALDRMRADIAETIDPLVKTGASENAARIAIDMLRR